MIIFVVSLIAAVGMSLLYINSEQEKISTVKPEETWNFSRLDRLTMAAFMDEKNAVWVSLVLMYTYTIIAYAFLYLFGSKMSDFEFYSSNAFIDNFVANHSLVITGVNKNMSPSQAARKVKKVFDYRYREEGAKVVSCNAFHKTDNLQKHWRKVKNYRAKVNDFQTESYASGEAQMIWVGSRLKCNKQYVEGSKYFQEKLDSAEK